MNVDDLTFDMQNPRMAEFDHGTDEASVIKLLWESMDVRELVQSIAASGYFPHEPLIVACEKGRNVVIEGNRRLAAVKLLLNRQLALDHDWEVPNLKAAALKELRQLPIIESTRKDAWRFLGFKHVNGPAKWSSYAKAKYIADVHREYDIPLSQIAEQIGDRHKTAQRLFRGLMVIEQAEKAKVFDRNDRFNPRFAFSHIYTGLEGDGISKFLGIADSSAESKSPVPKGKLTELKELCLWLYGSKSKKIEPVVKKQAPNLWELNSVLQNREA
ncbi:MAG: ParB N-terminal domain-containing protein, partial [Planctomycetaceae bacterium]|nr:ParB N-terminal domain-containing protein [Planctomycetaceae bacterium]